MKTDFLVKSRRNSSNGLSGLISSWVSHRMTYNELCDAVSELTHISGPLQQHTGLSKPQVYTIRRCTVELNEITPKISSRLQAAEEGRADAERRACEAEDKLREAERRAREACDNAQAAEQRARAAEQLARAAGDSGRTAGQQELESHSQQQVELSGREEPNPAALGLILSLIRYRDNLSIQLQYACEQKSELAEKLIRGALRQTEAILSDNGVSTLRESGAVDTERQEIAEVQPTDDSALHMHISGTVRDGYLYKNRMVRCQQVAVYQYSGK